MIPVEFESIDLDFSAISPLVGVSCHLPHPPGLDLADLGGHPGQGGQAGHDNTDLRGHPGQAVQGEDQQGGEGHGQPTTNFKQAVKSKAQVKQGEPKCWSLFPPLTIQASHSSEDHLGDGDHHRRLPHLQHPLLRPHHQWRPPC